METYTLEKWVWTDADFETMGWHDASIYAMQLNADLALDVDYIFKWNQPETEGFQFTFFVAPCTLIFKDVRDVSFDLNTSFYYKPIEVADIDREVIGDQQYYTIDTREGHLSFSASGYRQFVRMYPSFQLGQTIAYDERAGTSLEPSIDNKLNANIQAIVDARRAEEYEHYTWAKERHLLKAEMQALSNTRDANQVGLKEFIKEKNRLRDKLAYYNIILRDTRFEID
jgi:hypothetical protein